MQHPHRVPTGRHVAVVVFLAIVVMACGGPTQLPSETGPISAPPVATPPAVAPPAEPQPQPAGRGAKRGKPERPREPATRSGTQIVPGTFESFGVGDVVHFNIRKQDGTRGSFVCVDRACDLDLETGTPVHVVWETRDVDIWDNGNTERLNVVVEVLLDGDGVE